MKSYFKKILQRILTFLARAVLKKYQPDIIGVTGSVGKTSAKDAIYSVLSYKFNVRRNIKNFNNEIGLPLTIIGVGSGGRSIFAWLGVFIRAIWLLLIRHKNYPKILVLEMGVDRVGDMKYLTNLAPCQVGVVTNVGPVHLEYFKTIEKIAKEKSILVSHLDKNGWALLNADNEYVAEMKNVTKARVLTYGFSAEADLRALEVNVSQTLEKGIAGLSFKITYQGSTVPVLLPDVLGEHLIYAALAAAASGIVYGINLVDISQGLRNFVSPKGRMRLVAGINGSIIIDDSYNASPESAIAAIKSLGRLNSGGKKYAALGDMLELGEYAESGHRKVGEAIVENKIDILVAVGEQTRYIGDQAEKLGMSRKNIFNFNSSLEAGDFLAEVLADGDLTLVKGSQGMRMEKTVKRIMAEPEKAKDFLVRQDKPWQ